MLYVSRMCFQVIAALSLSEVGELGAEFCRGGCIYCRIGATAVSSSSIESFVSSFFQVMLTPTNLIQLKWPDYVHLFL